MGQAIAVRTDFTAGEVRRLAKRAKDAVQARRLLAIAAVLDGAFAYVPGRCRLWAERAVSPRPHGAQSCLGGRYPSARSSIVALTAAGFVVFTVVALPCSAFSGVLTWRPHFDFGPEALFDPKIPKRL